MEYIPHLFISIGETAAYYTLRETYMHEFHDGYSIRHQVRHYHHFNLSQDLDTAIEKAKEHAGRMCLELQYDYDVLKCEMRDIQRATADEMAARQAALEARQREWEAEQALREQDFADKLEAGIMPIGRYYGKTFEELPIGYSEWLLNGEFEPESKLLRVAEVYRVKCSHRALPKGNGRYIGEIGKRRVFEATVIKSIRLEMYEQYSRSMCYLYITKMVASTGELLVVKSSSFSQHDKEGSIIKFKATPKAHTIYRDEEQTILSRVTLI